MVAFVNHKMRQPQLMLAASNQQIMYPGMLFRVTQVAQQVW